MTYVLIKRTIVPLEPLVNAFVPEFELITGTRCEVIDAAIIFGKLVAECGPPNEKQACWNFNIGNLRGRSKRDNYTLLVNAYEFLPVGQPLPIGAREIPTPIGAKLPPGMRCYLPNPKNQEFRTFDSVQESMHEYMQVLGAHFPRVLRELLDTDTSPDDFVMAMKTDKYFTGDTGAYKFNVGTTARANIDRVSAIMKRIPEARTFEMLSRLDGGPATPLRAGEGEKTVRTDDVDLSSPPTVMDRIRRFFGKRD